MPKQTLTWGKTHDVLYSMLFTAFKKKYNDIDDQTFIDKSKNPRVLMSFVTKNEGWAYGTQKNIIFMIARYLQMYTDDKIYYKKYLEKGREMLDVIHSKESDNKQDEKEIENYRPHSYFMEILEQYKSTYKTLPYKEFIKILALALPVLQPPLRTDFYTTVKIIYNSKQNDKVGNFIFINRKTKQINYIVNDDKVTKSKYYNMRPELKIIQITDPFLKEMLFYTTQEPREYLFQSRLDFEEPISQNTFLSWLRSVSMVPNINNNMLRSSYVNWFYENNKTQKEREKLAHLMRHSVNAAQTYYLKVFEDEPKETKEEIVAEKLVLQAKLDNCEDNCKSVTTDKKEAKKRYDILFNVNNGKSKTIRESTKQKYNIQYDEETKKYY